jgi:methyltransferase of ATP-grasp peptide maturase system
MIQDGRSASLRRSLADELEGTGDLRSPRWRRAVERVPRHLFVPAFFQATDVPGRGALWAPVTDRQHDEWLELAYCNKTWVTQLDGHVTPHDVAEPVQGDPTSSSTLPGLVVRMLEALDVTDGMDVLEIGTGTGYSTALMCDRLGDEHVTSIEVDAGVAANAAAAVRAAGYAPRLMVGDGLGGVPEHAPYDRIIATCSVRHIPQSWLTQARPGGRILVTMSGWLHGHGLASLTVGEDGVAEGRFLPGTISFMIARPHAAPPLSNEQASEMIASLADADPRPATVGPDIRQDWTGAFVVQLAVPDAQRLTRRVVGGPWVDYYIDTRSGSIASLTPEPGGGWTVRQSGPVPLWDRVEDSIGQWRQIGSPPLERFRIRTDGRVQTVWVGTGDARLTWHLPVQ